MFKSLAILASSLTLITCAAIAAETQPVSQVFACNFNDGKGMSDLEAVTADFNAAIAKVGSPDLSESQSFLWLPYVSNTDRDFLWFSSYANLNQLARAVTAIEDSADAQAVVGKFIEMASCDSAILLNETIYDGEGDPVSDNQAVLESYVCTLHPGKTVADAQAVVEDWKGVVGGLDSTGGLLAVMRVPLIANTPIDLSYLLVHDSLTEYGIRQTNYMAAQGGELDAKFDEVHNCESSLWLGSQIVPAQEG